MYCNRIIVALLMLLAAQSASAQEWAKKMFKTASHDFGVVARGAKAEFAFEVENTYREDIHIAAVRTSCGCTTPKITKQTLKTWEKGQIIAEYNTQSFLGAKSATITVVIDRPYYAEVQLQVTGYIRSDVVFQPGAVDLGQVDQGQEGKQVVQISYAGRPDWRILDVRSANEHLVVSLGEDSREGGRVNYEMTVRLKPDTPVGYFYSQLLVITDDQNMKQIPLSVEGEVVSPLTVSPASLYLGDLEPGEKVTKQLIVRGQQPFKIVSVKCKDECFEFKTTDESKALHFIPVTFTAGDTPGQVSQTIEIETDNGAAIHCEATGTINPIDAAG